MVGQALNLQKLGWQEGQGRRSVSLTMHTEIDDALGHTIGIGSHAAIGSMIAGPCAHNGNNGAVGADVDVVCRVALGKCDVSVTCVSTESSRRQACEGLSGIGKLAWEDPC